MPKGVSKLRNELTSGQGCYAFLLEREDTAKKLSICKKLLTSLLRTRSNNKIRRDKYLNEIHNCFKKLCVSSTDLQLITQKLENTRNDLNRQGRKRADLQDKVVELEIRANQMEEYKARYEQQTELKHKIESEYGELLAQNDCLKQRLQNFKDKKKV
jgi:DNA repair ATPase RecN